MAQALQTNRRLLSTFIQTSNHYRFCPTLTSRVLFRGFAETTLSMKPSPTGFSVSFADGNLESLLNVPENQFPDGEVQNLTMIEKSENPRKVRPRTTNEKPKSRSSPKSRISKKDRAYTAELEVELEAKLYSPPEEEMISQSAVATPVNHQRPTRKISKSKTLPPNTKSLDLKALDPKSNQIQESSNSPPKRLPWQIQKAALTAKFGSDPWAPRKRLSPDTIEGIRALHAQYPDRYTTPVLAEQFAVSPEVIRRILKSKWSSNLDPEKQEERRERWARRHDRIWDAKAEMGLRPARKVDRKVEEGDEWEEGLRARGMLQDWRGS